MGQTKSVVVVALASGNFSVGNVNGPQAFQAIDLCARNVLAKNTVLATQDTAAGAVAVLFWCYVWGSRCKN